MAPRPSLLDLPSLLYMFLFVYQQAMLSRSSKTSISSSNMGGKRHLTSSKNILYYPASLSLLLNGSATPILIFGSNYVQNTNEPFALTIVGEKFYIIISPEDVAMAYRKNQQLNLACKIYLWDSMDQGMDYKSWGQLISKNWSISMV